MVRRLCRADSFGGRSRKDRAHGSEKSHENENENRDVPVAAVGSNSQPAAANWFARPALGINLNVGSAPSPSPYDLRMVEGYAVLRQSQVITVDMLRDMEGKTVIGENGEMLGTILTVDEGPQLVEVQLPTGVAVAVEARLLVDEPNRVIAPTLSRADMLEMARAQTGTAVALNIIHS